ncbi:hypothetical protein [Clostridium saccharoperbutylacetonicum]|uniref:hypothetical protein n=1 Tax=Clostridium saccharoperbutylacetonicum TaxID=36745 RepID=UPI001DAD06F9|nr:hypothetical protein [Clostridium saccharoperbutylacetonicum]NSB34780.1 plasmid maintenance system antidote protein VapI [Clostridium saccharoperbutylacetonicum]
MCNNLEAEIARKKIKKADIAEKIGRTYNTLNLKISGKYPFTYDEALIIHEKFSQSVILKNCLKNLI